MPNASSIIRQRLRVQNIGLNVFYEIADDGEERPYIVILQDSTEPHNTHNTASKLDRVQCRVLVFADRYETLGSIEGASNIANEIRTALDYYREENTVEIYFQNEQVDSVQNKGNKRAYMVEQYYDVWVYRTLGIISGTVLQADLEADLQG